MSRQVLYYNGEVACEKLHGYCQQYDTEEFTNYEYYLFTQYFFYFGNGRQDYESKNYVDQQSYHDVDNGIFGT